MPVFCIDYHRNEANEKQCYTIDWVTPEGWTSEFTKERFGALHPGATIVGMLNLSECPQTTS